MDYYQSRLNALFAPNLARLSHFAGDYAGALRPKSQDLYRSFLALSRRELTARDFCHYLICQRLEKMAF